MISPTINDFNPDLTSLGYTSVFLRVPLTPSTPHHKRSTKRNNEKSNKRKYPITVRPPPLANDLALMQFADGGKIDSHVKRLMDAQARAATGHSTHSSAGIGDVFRDEKGGIWWDQDEQWEYQHLLSPTTPDRRGSVSTVDSDFHASYVVYDRRCHDDLVPGSISPLLVHPSRSPAKKRLDNDIDNAFPVPRRTTERRRPAPLKLAPAASSLSDARRDFIESSFAPESAAKKKRSRMNLRGLFKRHQNTKLHVNDRHDHHTFCSD